LKTIVTNAEIQTYPSVYQNTIIQDSNTTSGSETWVMTKKIENVINSYERKILRMILGIINGNGTWRIKYNKEIYTYMETQNYQQL
jgi:hypothetical protein